MGIGRDTTCKKYIIILDVLCSYSIVEFRLIQQKNKIDFVETGLT